MNFLRSLLAVYLFLGVFSSANAVVAPGQAVEALPILLREVVANNARDSLIRAFGSEVGAALWIQGGQRVFEAARARQGSFALSSSDVTRLKAMASRLDGSLVFAAAEQLMNSGESLNSQTLSVYLRQAVQLSQNVAAPQATAVNEEQALMAFNRWSFTSGSPSEQWANAVRYNASPESRVARRNFGKLAIQAQQGENLCTVAERNACLADIHQGLENFAVHSDRLITNETAVAFEAQVLGAGLNHETPEKVFRGNRKVLSGPLANHPVRKCFYEGAR